MFSLTVINTLQSARVSVIADQQDEVAWSCDPECLDS